MVPQIWPLLVYAVAWGILSLYLRRRAMTRRTELGRERRVFEFGHFGLGSPEEFTDEGWRARNRFFAVVGLGAVGMLVLAVTVSLLATEVG